MIEQNQASEKDDAKAVSRRSFLAIASTSVALSASHLTEAQSKRRSFCVDCQSHLYAPEMVAFMKTRKSPPYGYEKGGDTYVVVGKWHRRLRENHMSPKAKVAAMDAAGIDVTVLSINDPGPERFGEDGIRAARLANDFVASVVREYPGRFCGLAFLPLQDMQAAQMELGRCVEKLGVKGIYLCSNINGEFPDEPNYRTLFKWAEELDLPIVMHPAYPVTYEQTKEYQLTAGLGLMFDTSIALARIIMAGILEQHPGLKLICPHVGGTLPYLIGRLDHQTRVLKRGLDNIKKLPSEYLKQVYFDTVSPIGLAIKYCYDLVGTDHLLYGSDHPWVQPSVIAGHIRQMHLPAENERKVFGGNARQLFKL
jgi:predicted TIM-barrel fold metal-dependent hydrolase